MKKIRITVGTGIVTLAVTVLLCGRKPTETPVLISGEDSLMREQVARLDPVTADERLRLRNVGIRLLCAGGLPDKSEKTSADQFAERLLLVSGTEWSDTAAALLLNAATKLYQSAQPLSCADVREQRDALGKKLAAIVQSPAAAVPVPAMQCDQATIAGPEGTVQFLQNLLGVSPELAGLIAEFIAIPEDTASFSSKADMKSIISGLVAGEGELADSASASKPATRSRLKAARRPVFPKDNSSEVLRYRNRESIRDSIQKHIPDLRQLYKKSLKSGDAFSGKVLVTIRVNAAGKVIQTAIKATNIDNKLFLDPFLGYIRTIRFKPVAKKLGAMTFDFPFEFNAEM